jgi:hypothetical protein
MIVVVYPDGKVILWKLRKSFVRWLNRVHGGKAGCRDQTDRTASLAARLDDDETG